MLLNGKFLAFDTSTDVMSIALTDGVRTAGRMRMWQHTGPGGAKASTTLIPAILALLADAGMALGDLQATMQATRLAVFALIDTHPAPEKAFAAFLDHMDHASDKLAPDRLPRYAAAMQQYRDALSAAAALQAKR